MFRRRAIQNQNGKRVYKLKSAKSGDVDLRLAQAYEQFRERARSGIHFEISLGRLILGEVQPLIPVIPANHPGGLPELEWRIWVRIAEASKGPSVLVEEWIPGGERLLSFPFCARSRAFGEMNHYRVEMHLIPFPETHPAHLKSVVNNHVATHCGRLFAALTRFFEEQENALGPSPGNVRAAPKNLTDLGGWFPTIASAGCLWSLLFAFGHFKGGASAEFAKWQFKVESWLIKQLETHGKDFEVGEYNLLLALAERLTLLRPVLSRVLVNKMLGEVKENNGLDPPAWGFWLDLAGRMEKKGWALFQGGWIRELVLQIFEDRICKQLCQTEAVLSWLNVVRTMIRGNPRHFSEKDLNFRDDCLLLLQKSLSDACETRVLKRLFRFVEDHLVTGHPRSNWAVHLLKLHPPDGGHLAKWESFRKVFFQVLDRTKHDDEAGEGISHCLDQFFETHVESFRRCSKRFKNLVKVRIALRREGVALPPEMDMAMVNGFCAAYLGRFRQETLDLLPCHLESMNLLYQSITKDPFPRICEDYQQLVVLWKKYCFEEGLDEYFRAALSLFTGYRSEARLRKLSFTLLRRELERKGELEDIWKGFESICLLDMYHFRLLLIHARDLPGHHLNQLSRIPVAGASQNPYDLSGAVAAIEHLADRETILEMVYDMLFFRDAPVQCGRLCLTHALQLGLASLEKWVKTEQCSQCGAYKRIPVECRLVDCCTVALISTVNLKGTGARFQPVESETIEACIQFLKQVEIAVSPPSSLQQPFAATVLKALEIQVPEVPSYKLALIDLAATVVEEQVATLEVLRGLVDLETPSGWSWSETVISLCRHPRQWRTLRHFLSALAQHHLTRVRKEKTFVGHNFWKICAAHLLPEMLDLLVERVLRPGTHAREMALVTDMVGARDPKALAHLELLQQLALDEKEQEAKRQTSALLLHRIGRSKLVKTALLLYLQDRVMCQFVTNQKVGPERAAKNIACFKKLQQILAGSRERDSLLRN